MSGVGNFSTVCSIFFQRFSLFVAYVKAAREKLTAGFFVDVFALVGICIHFVTFQGQNETETPIVVALFVCCLAGC